MIRVLVVDDSALVRRLLTEGLAEAPDIEVVGTAVDPYDAREQIVRLTPDVITLDLEMPRMDGLSFLSRLMKYHPMPVVVVSSLTPRNSEAAFRAFELGAVEVIAKPDSASSLPEVAGQLLLAIRAAAGARVVRPTVLDAHVAAAGGTTPGDRRRGAAQRIIAIGASTGGPVAIEQLLSAVPAHGPPILIVQHMPAGFTTAFANRLNQRCAITVREAADGDVVIPGHALIAPGGLHLLLERRDNRLVAAVRAGPPVHFQRPAVDVLFHSVAHAAAGNAVGVLLTGMGCDGASGMRALHDAGMHTIVQDERTSVVFSMPREAIRFGGAREVLPLSRIAAAALAAASSREPSSAHAVTVA
jgi:two-component system, chemotaxis family, protein-glutamate methylesterase/glutaminase